MSLQVPTIWTFWGFIVINPMVPVAQKIKISNLTLNRLLIIEFVKKMVYLGAHDSERQGLMGYKLQFF